VIREENETLPFRKVVVDLNPTILCRRVDNLAKPPLAGCLQPGSCQDVPKGKAKDPLFRGGIKGGEKVIGLPLTGCLNQEVVRYLYLKNILKIPALQLASGIIKACPTFSSLTGTIH
jgi:hypothetical protein